MERWPSCALWKTASLVIFLLSACILQSSSVILVNTALLVINYSDGLTCDGSQIVVHGGYIQVQYHNIHATHMLGNLQIVCWEENPGPPLSDYTCAGVSLYGLHNLKVKISQKYNEQNHTHEEMTMHQGDVVINVKSKVSLRTFLSNMLIWIVILEVVWLIYYRVSKKKKKKEKRRRRKKDLALTSGTFLQE